MEFSVAQPSRRLSEPNRRDGRSSHEAEHPQDAHCPYYSNALQRVGDKKRRRQQNQNDQQVEPSLADIFSP
jgi:hypothetical protein